MIETDIETPDKKGKKPNILIYKYADDVYLEKDPTCFILNVKNKSWYYPTLSGAFAELSASVFIEKMAKMPDELKTDLSNIVKLIDKHDEDMKKMFRGL